MDRGMLWILAALFTSGAVAQPVPSGAIESLIDIEIRYRNTIGTTVFTRRIPSPEGVYPSYHVMSMWGWVYTHVEPCWNTASDCVIGSMTVKTLIRDPILNIPVNWTGVWCKTNSSGQCPMPSFQAVTVIPGAYLCFAFDRSKGAWKEPPHVCTPADFGKEE